MAVIAEEMKAQAQASFEREVKAKGNSLANKQQQLQLQHRGRLNRSPAQGVGKQRESRVRGLAELTGDALIFGRLHMRFTWILRMSSCQISEEFVHGPVSEDWQVRAEREQQMGEFLGGEEEKTPGSSGGGGGGELVSEGLDLTNDDFDTANEVCLNQLRVGTIRQLIQVGS